MADEISKKIIIEVEAQTDKLQQTIASLNQIITELQANQKKLTESGNDNSAAFDKNAGAIDKYQKQVSGATKQLSSFNKNLNASATSLKKNESLINALAKANETLSKSVSAGSAKLSDLDKTTKSLVSTAQNHQAKTQQGKAALDAHNQSLAEGAKQAKQLKKEVSELNSGLIQQQTHANKSKTAFDAHGLTMDHLKKSFNEIKDVSGIFGPSLQDAAKGFNVMKTGLDLVHGGLNGVGEAIKTDGFGFLLDIIQKIYDYFINTSEGSKELKGAISAVGVIVNKVTSFFHALMDVIINAFSHPIDTLKSLGNMIEQNLINRFKAFSVILDGIIHLDFKKVADGAIQAATGVTNATDKMKNAWKSVKEEVKTTVGDMVTACKKGYDEVNQEVKTNEASTTASLKRIKQANNDCAKQIVEYNNQTNSSSADSQSESPIDQEVIPSIQSSLTDYVKSILEAVKDIVRGPGEAATNDSLNNSDKESGNDEAKKETDKKKKAIKEVEDFAKQSANKIAAEGLSILTNSIKQQSEAKIAALEKDKALELSNKSLTSAQRQAIEQKYKKKEDAIKLKAFKEQQKISIGQAIINGAIAITKSEADLGPIAGTIAIAAIVANTAAQIATISAQKPPALAKGGYFKSDGKGTVLSGYSRTDNTNAYLRSGEAVVVSEAMRDPWARNLVSAINVAYGGRDFSVPNVTRGYAVGGIFTDGGNANRYYNQPVNDQKNLANTVAYQMINNFPPVYVDVKDVNNQQNILAQTINRVNL